MTETLGVAVLAAGSSRRMGKPKLLLPMGNLPILAHVLKTAASFSWGDRIVIIGEPREALAAVCQDYGIPASYNPEYEKGQAASLRLAINHLRPDIEGILFLLGDQPLVGIPLIRALVEEFQKRQDRRAIVVPHYRGQNRSPALFGSYWRSQLAQTSGDQGGRVIIRENHRCVIQLPWDDARPFKDIDTWQDYESLCKEFTHMWKGSD